MGHAGLTLPPNHLARTILGRTGLEVSALALGTAALGIDYGLPGSPDFARPDFEASVGLMRRAYDAGITFFDTAPAYGIAEDIVGTALADLPDAVIASKVSITWDRDRARAADILSELRRSVESSLKRLGRDRLHILQLHSATATDLADDRVLRALEGLRKEGRVLALGATVYDETAGLAAINSGVIDVIQITFNILDQRAFHRLFAAAADHGVGVLTRSALLKGALTSRRHTLPKTLGGLAKAVEQVVTRLGTDDTTLAPTALRFCLSHIPPISSVLIGAATVAELDEALAAAAAGPLSAEVLARAAECAIDDEKLLNPSLWPAA